MAGGEATVTPNLAHREHYAEFKHHWCASQRVRLHLKYLTYLSYPPVDGFFDAGAGSMASV